MQIVYRLTFLYPQILNPTGRKMLGTLTDRLAKVTDCTVTLPAQSVSHHIQSGSPYLGQARYLQTGLFD